jgi:hypothetical protein
MRGGFRVILYMHSCTHAHCTLALHMPRLQHSDLDSSRSYGTRCDNAQNCESVVRGAFLFRGHVQVRVTRSDGYMRMVM